ncbi:MAG: energy-coupling factor ABC transporter permease [Anaerolinea sp.]|jgi:cobalt/nickel transport system permease protein
MLYSPAPMHIPDGFLSVPLSIALWIISIVVIALSTRRVSQDLGEREVPVMGVLAAAIFAGQMLNFTVTGGTSGHLMGAALATILLGPWAAVLIMTCVVGVQALIFQDGGLLALGANLFNMAVVGPFVSYPIYRFFQRMSTGRKWGVFVGSFIAAWTSIFIASLAVALQLALSGTSPANIAFPAMGGIHALIGIGEGLITLGAVSLIYASRRDLLKLGEPQPKGSTLIWIGGTLLAILLAVLSPLASSNPDGLEWVAEQAGFLERASEPSFTIIPDYIFPGIPNETLATIIAGILGTLLVLGVTLGIAYLRRQKTA